jgi:hypothetical protein
MTNLTTGLIVTAVVFVPLAVMVYFVVTAPLGHMTEKRMTTEHTRGLLQALWTGREDMPTFTLLLKMGSLPASSMIACLKEGRLLNELGQKCLPRYNLLRGALNLDFH